MSTPSPSATSSSDVMQLFANTILYTQHDQKDHHGSDAKMIQIRSSQEVSLLAGRIVAYLTDSSYLGTDKRFALPDIHSSIHFGYVDAHTSQLGCSKSKKIGYYMTRLIKTGEAPSGCILTDLALSEAPLQMRIATEQEISAIQTALKQNVAAFEHFSAKEIAPFLEMHLTFIAGSTQSKASLKTLDPHGDRQV